MSTTPTDTDLLNELAHALLGADEVTLCFVEQLGTAYEQSNHWPSRWVSEVIRRGIATALSKELLRRLILKDFNDRLETYDAQDVNGFIDGLYAEQKEICDRNPELYRARLLS